MKPRSEGIQRCLSFELILTPRAKQHSYRDYLGNSVCHFDIPGYHSYLTILAEALVEMNSAKELPASLDQTAWHQLDQMVGQEDHWDMLMPSQFARPIELTDQLATEFNLTRRTDPLSLLRELNQLVYQTFSYKPKSTKVDSPIDEALRTRQGVCQDFAHIMIVLVRKLGIPCRYVSGYLFHRTKEGERSANDASHAWVEALLPGLGWIGFDPTNNLIAADRHIRTAIGRDYADVPPTRGVFKGFSESECELSVAVNVVTSDPPALEKLPPETYLSTNMQQQQQQQQ